MAGSNIPVLPTYKGKGVVPDSWPNVGPPFTGGTIEAPLLNAADLIVAVGLDLVEVIPGPWPFDAPVLSLAEWAEESHLFRPELEIVGPLELSLEAIASAVEDDWEDGRGRLERERALGRLQEIEGGELGPFDVATVCRDTMPPGTVLLWTLARTRLWRCRCGRSRTHVSC